MRPRTRNIRASRRVLAVLAAGVVTASFATLAAAAPFPAQHFSLVPVGGEPLRDGFVEVIHPEGPEVYARHVYHLKGAGRALPSSCCLSPSWPRTGPGTETRTSYTIPSCWPRSASAG
jgi:hypothetical protein